MKIIDGCLVFGNSERPLHPCADDLQKVDLFAQHGTSVCGGALRDRMDEGDGALILAHLAGDDMAQRNPVSGVRGFVLATNFGASSTMSWCWQERLDTGGISSETYEPAENYVRKMAEVLGCSGPVCQVSMSCASGVAALRVAQDMLEAGRADSVLVVAYDEFAGYAATGLKILRTISPEGRVLPFDVRRHGTVFGDGAAAVLLAGDDAPGEGLGFVMGTATNNNAFHVTAPRQEGEGSRLVMEAALKNGGVAPGEVRHVTAHATGTVANDSTESAALRNLLGASCEVSLAAYKRVLGHKLGAAGLMELLFTVDAVYRGNCASPYVPDFQPDEKCAPFCSIGNDGAVRGPALIDAAGIGGNNAAAVYGVEPSGNTPVLKQGNGRVYIRSMGWVLPDNVGSGDGLLKHPEWLENTDASGLAGFSAKEYLSSVKGYLDPASAYLLAACRLALGESSPDGPDVRRGLCLFTEFGCPSSAFQFYKMFSEKGEHASPLLFPHTYSNTPSCLAAMENGLAGPHMVFYGEQDFSNALDFAKRRLLNGDADEMLLARVEAMEPNAFPDSVKAVSGAVVWVLSANSGENDLGTM